MSVMLLRFIFSYWTHAQLPINIQLWNHCASHWGLLVNVSSLIKNTTTHLCYITLSINEITNIPSEKLEVKTVRYQWVMHNCNCFWEISTVAQRKLESINNVVHCSARSGLHLWHESENESTAHISNIELDLNYQTSELTFIRLQRAN